MRKKFQIPNGKWQIFNSLLLATCFLLQASLWSVTPKTNVPLSHYTEFKVENKSQNTIDIDVSFLNTTLNLIQGDDFKTKLISEFNETKSPFIYQSKLIALPEHGDVHITVKKYDSLLIPLDNTLNLIQSEIDYDNLPIAYLGQPAIMRDFRVAPINVRQYYYDKTTKNIICYSKVDVEIKFSEPVTILSSASQISNDWISFYRNSILNFDESSIGPFNLGLPQGYLIIVADALYDSILPFARWKNLKGYTVTVKRISEIGSGTNYIAIRNYIKQAYETWSPRLEYVLIVGTHSLIYGYPISTTPNVGDHFYSCVSDDDLYPDLLIGRLPASNINDLRVMIAKILGYERTPYLADTLWFRRALMVGTQYSTGQPVWTALATKRWVRNLLLQHNYLRVDTVFDPPIQNGVGIIDTIVNRGVTFINGRGWGNSEGWHRPQFYKDNVNNLLNNGWKLPIVTSFYCGTGNYANPARCFGEVWLLAGTPTAPKGAVAFYGPTYLNTSSRFNNCQDYGVYWGIFEENINSCGPAMFRGKLELLNNYVMPADTKDLRIHVCTYNLLGDPSLEMWTGEVPKSITANYPSEIPVGSSSFNVSVSNAASQPIPGALVSLYKAGEIKTTTYTDNSGNATFNFTTQTQDTLFVTVTKHNYAPHLGNVRITTQPVYVGYYNNSENVIAGQTTSLSVTLKNYGSSQTASNTIATLRTQNNQVAILDSVKSYGNIGPNQTAVNTFQLSVATNCTNNHRINFQLHIVSGSNTWEGLFSVLARSPELVYQRHTVNDGGNQILDPGETTNLIVNILNHGSENINNISGILRCTNPFAIQVLDSIGNFGNISAGDSAQNNSDYFTVHASSGIADGHIFHFQLILSNGSYHRTLEFPITIGVITSTAPIGPDNYGYFAYDNTDITYNEHPVYSWVEIDPNFGGSGTRIPLSNDAIKVINLPFTFRYYGRNFNKISVCSNGYIAMDSSRIVDQYNWRIPSPFGPPAMIAPFWDDFHPDTLGASGVYYYYDSPNNRFIIEWSRVRHIHGFRDPSIAEQQTFQVILYNQAYYHTRTTDGPILFQYQTVFNDDSLSSDCHNYATVGIENFEQTVGIEYSYAGRYPSAAAQLENSRTIKFTTNLPDTFTAISEQKSELGLRIEEIKITALPNPFKSLSTIRYTIPIQGDITIGMYDINGKLIKQILRENKTHGIYQIQLSQKNLPTGIYFLMLTLKNNNITINKNIKVILY